MKDEVVNKKWNMVLDSELVTLLNQDWSDYDKRKLLEGSDSRVFCCSVPWEVDYLVQKICSAHPKYTPKHSRRAINMVCMASLNPAPRTAFLEQVMGILYLL